MRLVRPLALLLLLAALVGTAAWAFVVVAEGNGKVVPAVVGIAVVAALLFAPGVVLGLLWRRGVEAMAAGERLKGDVRTLVQAPQGVDEAAALGELRRRVQGAGTWRGSRLAATGLAKLVWQHRGAVWNGKEAAELVRPPGPVTLFVGLLGGLVVLVASCTLVVVALAVAAT